MSQTTLTWAQYHPEVVEAFEHMVSWPCEKIHTDLGPCSQPSLVLGPGQELITEGLRARQLGEARSGQPDEGVLYHSTDAGRSWSTLCQVPIPIDIPTSVAKRFGPSLTGVGVLRDGTLLAKIRVWYYSGEGGVDDETVQSRVWITRSTDRGDTWSEPFELDPSPYEAIGGNKVRFHQRDGTVLIPVNCTRYARPGKPLAAGEAYETAQVYASTNGGLTWQHHGAVGKYSDETDFLTLPSGRILTVTRYQRRKMPDDPPGLQKPGGGDQGSVYKQSVICHSDDGGKSFSAHRLLTAWLQQTACLVRLADGTVIAPFGHKDDNQGQRFMVSYDEGQTWCKKVFELNKSGMYASSQVLSDGTVVTVYAVEGHSGGRNRLDVLRWRPPPREQVETNGFFTPRPAAIA